MNEIQIGNAIIDLDGLYITIVFLTLLLFPVVPILTSIFNYLLKLLF